MNPKKSQDSIISRYLPPIYALIALAVAFLAPVWAIQWYRQPFLGLFLEPHLVASQIGRADWPAKSAGVQWSDRLVAVEGEPVATWADVYEVLDRTGFAPVQLSFEKRQGAPYQVMVAPRPVRLSELIQQFIVPYAVGLVFLASGIWAYRLSDRQRPARAFLLFTAAISIVTTAFLDMNTTHHFLIGWSLSLPVAGGALAHLGLVFPRPMRFVERHPVARYLTWITTVLVILPTLYDLGPAANPWSYIESWRLGYVYTSGGMLLFLASLLVRIFHKSAPIVRQQSRIIIFGALVAFGPVLFLYLIPSSFGGTPQFQAVLYAPPMVLLPLTVAYAIARYRLLDVDRVLSQFLVYGLVTGAALGLFYLLVTVLSFLLQETLAPNDPLVVAIYLFVLVAALSPLRQRIQAGIDRIFYRSRADYRRLMTEFSRDLVVTPDLQQVLHTLERVIKRAVRPERLTLYLYSDDRQVYLPYGKNDPEAIHPILPADKLISRLRLSPDSIWTLAIPLEKWETAQLSSPELLPGYQVFTPLNYEGRLIGFLALGPRRSGQPYSGDDLEFLSAIAGQSSLAVENARLFTNLARMLEDTMEMKNLMDDIFASIASGVITTDLQQQVTQFNHAAERILGVPAAEVVGQPLPDVLPWLGYRLVEMASGAIQNGEMVVGHEMNPILPERGPLHLRLSCTPLRDAHLGTKGAAIVIDDLTRQRQIEAEREMIRQTFGRVVAPRVRDQLLADPSSLRLSGARQPITVLFADMAQFTPFSEQTTPEEVLKVLNSYLSLATQSILDEEGTLDKFIGDAVMAFWNAPDRQPDHTLRAVRAALAMDAAFKAYRHGLPPAQQHFFTMGIHCGEAMVGNVGANELFNYTAVGDTVNLAQRLETIARPGQILLSEAAYQQVAAQVEARRLSPVRVKGRRQEVVVYELIGLKPGPQARS